VRWVPYCAWDPGWRREHLATALRDAYEWCPALGNTAHRSGGPVQIADPDHGLAVLFERLERRPVVILCACHYWRTCHRGAIAAMAQEERPALAVRHLVHGSRFPQLDRPYGR
jgi:hypothetical protein